MTSPRLIPNALAGIVLLTSFGAAATECTYIMDAARDSTTLIDPVSGLRFPESIGNLVQSSCQKTTREDGTAAIEARYQNTEGSVIDVNAIDGWTKPENSLDFQLMFQTLTLSFMKRNGNIIHAKNSPKKISCRSTNEKLHLGIFGSPGDDSVHLFFFAMFTQNEYIASLSGELAESTADFDELIDRLLEILRSFGWCSRA